MQFLYMVGGSNGEVLIEKGIPKKKAKCLKYSFKKSSIFIKTAIEGLQFTEN